MFNVNSKVVMTGHTFGELSTTGTMRNWIESKTVLNVITEYGDIGHNIIRVTDEQKTQASDFRNFRFASEEEIKDSEEIDNVELELFDIVDHPEKGRGVVMIPNDSDNEVRIAFPAMFGGAESRYYNQKELREFTKVSSISDVEQREGSDGWTVNTLRLEGQSISGVSYPNGIERGMVVDVTRKNGQVEYQQTVGDISKDLEAAFWNYSGHNRDIIKFRKHSMGTVDVQGWIENNQTESNVGTSKYPEGVREGMIVDVVRFDGDTDYAMEVGDFANDMESAYWVVEGVSNDIVKYRFR